MKIKKSWDKVADNDKQYPGHTPKYHKDGYSTPIGLIKDFAVSAAELTLDQLTGLGFSDGKMGELHFESGISVKGVLTDYIQEKGKNIILTFENCTVQLGDKLLYQPAWGPFDMACGAKVMSTYGDAADRYAYIKATKRNQDFSGYHKSTLTEENKDLNNLYAKFREIRESGKVNDYQDDLNSIVKDLNANYQNDWLLRWELLELNITEQLSADWAGEVLSQLENLRSQSDEWQGNIDRGLALLTNN